MRNAITVMDPTRNKTATEMYSTSAMESPQYLLTSTSEMVLKICLQRKAPMIRKDKQSTHMCLTLESKLGDMSEANLN